MASENFINLKKNENNVRLTVLTNICRMMISRGYMDINKYRMKEKSKRKSPVEPEYDHIDNDKFLPFIEKRMDDNIYKIPLDKNYVDERTDNKDNKFNGSKLMVKIINQNMKDITNSPVVNDFLKSYDNYHKIIVFDDMENKVYTKIHIMPNAESFNRDYLMIDMMSHQCAPISCSLVTNDDISYINKPNLPKMASNDPLTRYYNGKKGNILRVIRPSLNNSQEVALLKITDPKPLMK
jgi:hypothetical protein